VPPGRLLAQRKVWRELLRQHPNSRFAEEARARLDQ
jgi:outer membrane protein assembly factor BamD (BamD/ComL family)